MKRLAAMFILLVCMTSLTGCFHQKVIVNSNYDTSKTTPDVDNLQIHLFGLVNLSGNVNLNKVCRKGADRVESKMLFNIGLLTFTKAQVYCRN